MRYPTLCGRLVAPEHEAMHIRASHVLVKWSEAELQDWDRGLSTGKLELHLTGCSQCVGRELPTRTLTWWDPRVGYLRPGFVSTFVPRGAA